MKTYIAALLADIHVGSMFAPWPQGFVDSRGAARYLNPGQQYIERIWNEGLKVCPPLDLLIINGDVIDGEQYRQEKRYLLEPNIEWQAKAAKVLLKPWVDKLRPSGSLYWTRGTKYHESGGSAWVDDMAQKLGAVPNKAGEHTWFWRNMDIDGVKLDVAHRQSFYIRYRSTPLERELEFDVLVADLKKGSADLVVRSHVHRFHTVCVDLRQGVSTPGWQIQTEFALQSISPNRVGPSRLGFVLLYITPEKKERGLLPIHIEPITWPHPQIEVECVNVREEGGSAARARPDRSVEADDAGGRGRGERARVVGESGHEQELGTDALARNV